jgi:hypothetical protein
VLSDAQARRLRERHRDYKQAHDRVWLERIRAGLAYRRAMREIDEAVQRRRARRDESIRESVGAGASYREVARALGRLTAASSRSSTSRPAAPR